MEEELDLTGIGDEFETRAELCKRDLFEFVKEFWSVVIPETPVYNWHIVYLCKELQKINERVVLRAPKEHDLIINIPPGTTKSTIVTVMYPAWVWAVDPKQRIMTASYSKSLAIDHALKSREIIKSDKYQKMFPYVQLTASQDNKQHYVNSARGERYATATKATATGFHAHQQIIDDPHDVGSAASDTEREVENNFVTNTLATRKVRIDMTPRIIVMQRLHEKDASGTVLLKARKGSRKAHLLKHICLPADLREGKVKPAFLEAFYKDGLLDPVRLSRDVLDEAKENLGSYAYAGQYSQIPAPDEGGIFDKAWFGILPWSEKDHERLRWNFTADTAYTKDETRKNDPSGFLAYAKKGKIYYFRRFTRGWWEFPELCKELPKFCKLNGYSNRSLVMVEPKANGKSLVQTLRTNTSLNVKEGKPPSKDKISRAKDVSPIVEANRVVLLEDPFDPWTEDFLQEVCTFPNAAHDEAVDVMTAALSKDTRKKKGVR